MRWADAAWLLVLAGALPALAAEGPPGPPSAALLELLGRLTAEEEAWLDRQLDEDDDAGPAGPPGNTDDD